VREQASEVARGVGGKFKSVWGNLKAMTEKDDIFKNYQAKTFFFLKTKYPKTS
jgi:hypothetical protein